MRFIYLFHRKDGSSGLGFSDNYSDYEIANKLYIEQIRQAVKRFGGILPVTVLNDDFEPLFVLYEHNVRWLGKNIA